MLLSICSPRIISVLLFGFTRKKNPIFFFRIHGRWERYRLLLNNKMPHINVWCCEIFWGSLSSTLHVSNFPQFLLCVLRNWFYWSFMRFYYWPEYSTRLRTRRLIDDFSQADKKLLNIWFQFFSLQFFLPPFPFNVVPIASNFHENETPFQQISSGTWSLIWL